MPKVSHIVRLPIFFMTHLLLYAAGLLVLGRGFSAYIAISIGKKDNQEVDGYTMSPSMYSFNDSNLIVNRILSVCTIGLFCIVQSTWVYVLTRGNFLALIT